MMGIADPLPHEDGSTPPVAAAETKATTKPTAENSERSASPDAPAGNGDTLQDAEASSPAQATDSVVPSVVNAAGDHPQPQAAVSLEPRSSSAPNGQDDAALPDAASTQGQETAQAPTSLPNFDLSQIPEHLHMKVPEFPDSDDDMYARMLTPLPNALRYPVTVAFGPRGGWYIRWSDGTSGWESLPPTLHAKLNNRLPSLPGVRQLSMSDNNDWFVSFDDGSFATSGFPPRGKLFDALHGDADADVTNLVFAPGGGFLLTREDGTAVWERLPSGINDLLKRRQRSDPSVDYVAISKLGGWFIMFQDRECVWEGLPPQLTRILVQIVRKNPPHLVVALSPVDMMAYFIGVGHASESNIEYPTLKAALEWQKGEKNAAGEYLLEKPQMNVNFTGAMPVPPVESAEFEDLFRRAAGGDNSDPWGAEDDQDPDDELKSSVGGGGSVVEVKLPSGHSQSRLDLDYSAHIDGNVEAEEGGRILLRAASSSLIDQKDLLPKSSSGNRWSLIGSGSQNGVTPPATFAGPQGTTSTPPTPSTTGITGFFSSVFGLSSKADKESAAALPPLIPRPRSRGAGELRSHNAHGHHAHGGGHGHTDTRNQSFTTSANSPEDDDEYDGETDLMLDRVAQLKGQIQERLSLLQPDSPYILVLKRFSDSLDEHAYQLTSTRSAASPEQLADAEYFVLYAEGWLEASEPHALPNPWLNGWLEGRFGCGADEVYTAVERHTAARDISDTAAETGATPTAKGEQATVDAHLKLSYEYERAFFEGSMGNPAITNSDKKVVEEASTLRLNPRDILYTAKSVNDSAGSLYHRATDIARGTAPRPVLRVVSVDGRHYAVDNATLWALRAARVDAVACVEADAGSVDGLEPWTADAENGRSVDIVEG
ncbi:hypothetical protein HDU86_002648 [Geranomyces michiganensis]|nr:hypothetical protein HDU86_002648 [Geranomyces michiganensis]